MTAHVVTGWPCSGTTAMVAALGSTGLPIVADPASATLEPNRMQRRFGLVVPGDFVVKLVMPHRMVSLPRGRWKVIVMRRDPDEIVASWDRRFSRPWDRRRYPPSEMGAVLDGAVAYVRSRSDVLSVDEIRMAELREDPAGVLQRLGRGNG